MAAPSGTKPSGFFKVYVQHYNARGRGGAPKIVANNMTWRESAALVERESKDETVYWAYSEPQESGE